MGTNNNIYPFCAQEVAGVPFDRNLNSISRRDLFQEIFNGLKFFREIKSLEKKNDNNNNTQSDDRIMLAPSNLCTCEKTEQN